MKGRGGPMNVVDLIIRKRDGQALEPGRISELIARYTDGEVPDYQMSAFLMAAFLRGLDGRETAELMQAMLHSGTVLDLSGIPGRKVDKHSTGGVGDKTSLVIAPLAAACGVVVPMISGRGLGHTGGTLDKLEAIPGFRTDLTLDEFRAVLSRLGTGMVGQTDDLAPADRGLYALRDVTGTVESIPLIAASIMSKKLAEGLDGLVLDVKFGAGAFMRAEADARRLAETLVAVGEANGCRAVALLTDMDAPLGYACGNWIEVVEAVDCLQDGGPDDLRELSLALTGEMICLAGIEPTPEAGVRRAARALGDGSAFERFERLVEAQGGSAARLTDPAFREARPPVAQIVADRDGVVASMDARQIGNLCVQLGAGRTRVGEKIDPLSGILLNKKPGDTVACGEVLAWIHASGPERVEGIDRALASAIVIGEFAGPAPLIRGRYADGRWVG